MEQHEKIEAAQAAVMASSLAKANIEVYLKLHGIDLGQTGSEDESAKFNMKIADESAKFNMKIADESAKFNMKIVDETEKEISKIVDQAAELAARKLKEFIDAKSNS